LLLVHQLNDTATLLNTAGKLSSLLLKRPKGCCFVIRAAVNSTVHGTRLATAMNKFESSYARWQAC
jgi:hypothetical protein